jgi:purine-binding chemotaxis protein CheW
VTITEEQNKAIEVLAFKVGQEEYGLSILKVQEIRCYEAVTPIASTPDYIKGIINLRGVIVPSSTCASNCI